MGVGPITFEVFRNGLVAVAEQMSAIIWRMREGKGTPAAAGREHGR